MSMSSSAGEPGPDLAAPLDCRAYQSPASIVRFVIPAAIGLVADLWLKAWSFPNGVPAEGPAGRHPAEFVGRDWAVIPHVLGFQTTVNHGAVFGIYQGMAFYFLLFSIFAMAMIVWVFATSRSSHWIVHIALGMITAGALGNLYDRAMFNGVRDMLRFLCFHFPPIHLLGIQYPSGPIAMDGTADWYPYIFNIADVMLCVGVPMLMLRWLFVKDGPAKPAAAAAPSGT
jgi:signal peptidase II